jgi:hypothetical protein
VLQRINAKIIVARGTVTVVGAFGNKILNCRFQDISSVQNVVSNSTHRGPSSTCFVITSSGKFAFTRTITDYDFLAALFANLAESNLRS